MSRRSTNGRTWHTLQGRAHRSELFRRGRRYRSNGLTIVSHPELASPDSKPAVMVIPARGHRLAVARNRSRRRGRALVDIRQQQIRRDARFALILSPERRSWEEELTHFDRLLQRAGLFSENS